MYFEFFTFLSVKTLEDYLLAYCIAKLQKFGTLYANGDFPIDMETQHCFILTCSRG